MPFKSQAQRRKFYALEREGKISKETLRRWEEETPDWKKLPERVAKKERVSMKKVAFGSPILNMLGLLGPGAATGYAAGREAAGQTAHAVAPRGRKTRAEAVARKVGIPLSILGALVAMYKSRGLPVDKITAAIRRKMPQIKEQEAELLVSLLLPAGAGLAGGTAAGLGTGLAVGGVQRFRGSPYKTKKRPRITGAASSMTS